MPYHPQTHLSKPNHLLDHEQHSYQYHHPQACKEIAEPGPRLSSTSRTTFAQYLQPYAKSWTAKKPISHIPNRQRQPTLRHRHHTLLRHRYTIRFRILNWRHREHRNCRDPTENNSSSQSRGRSTAFSPTPRPSSPLPEPQPDTRRRTSTRNASGRSGQHFNVSARRNQTANQTSTRQEQQPVKTQFVAR